LGLASRQTSGCGVSPVSGRLGDPLSISQADATGLDCRIGKDPESAIKKVHDLGVPSCQVGVGAIGPDWSGGFVARSILYNIEATSVVVGFPGPEVYDFYQGPETIGFVPRQWRAARN